MKIDAVGVHPYQATFAGRSAQAEGFSDVLNHVTQQNKGTSLDDIFQRASETYGVPENLLRAVGKAESGFQADAVSRCGAQGIMQLMPATAKSLGVQDSFDPEQNVMGGAKYLGSLLNRYGDAKLALAAYNAGSGNVEKYGGIPPFRETQNYVEKVLSYAGGDLTVPQGSGSASGTTGGISSLPSASFTTEDYSRFLELFAQQLLQRSLSSLGGEEEEQQDAIFTQFS